MTCVIDNGSTNSTGILISIRSPVLEELRNNIDSISVSRLAGQHSFSLIKGCKSPKFLLLEHKAQQSL